MDKDQLMAAAYPAGQRDKVFSTQFGANPLDLPLLANTSYDLVVHLTDGRSYEIDRQQVQEGNRLDFELQARDFKP